MIQARDEAARALEELDAEERARRERERQAAALRDAFESTRAAALEAERASEIATEARERNATELARIERAVADAREALERQERDLAAALAGWPSWRERLAAGAASFAADIRSEVEAWLARAADRDAAEERARSLGPELASSVEKDESARASLAQVKAELSALTEVLSAKTEERASVIDGADPDAHERALGGRVAEARAASRAAQEAFNVATREAAERASRSERAVEARDEARAELRAAQERARVALAENELEEADARARLAHDPAEIASWQQELSRLDAARKRGDAVVEERTRRREAFENDEPPRLGAEEAERAMTLAIQRAEQTREELVSARHVLMRDDEQRLRAAELAAEVEAQRRGLAVWDALSDLIGSASGAKLRVFAQSLTLELLLDHANHHLAELAPRYSLARVPGEDLALMVIDREMGDEVRSVGSLSGGESFLVALGMALGLASLSSQRTRIDSLFIDEGFGALDPASLDMVLSTLDRLQASGRQVGVISHVPTMAERFDTRVSVVAAGPARSRVELVEGHA